ncbi:MAG: DUF2158 domain-containing protein [Bacteroidota bacterium]|nr:DUF2158 domain-containing protein [Bacteroidota bacterium]MDP4234052.1 DUF2158 domain-containing protein [Bacteroidota bacterium]MDP4242918.1 DUF2158 domain-containing protein [Bacteroidota bacterium]MDP4289267.1 DUF2158 domain-containing protein [Bacteroidota bacterium]
MANQTWKEGDEVWHKSGGPKMVVDEVSAQGLTITCKWHLNGEFKTQDFHPNALTNKDPNS